MVKQVLAVIETPIGAYLLALVCDNKTVIDIIYTFNENNYNVEDAVSVCNEILEGKAVRRTVLAGDGFDWMLGDRRKIYQSVKESFVQDNIDISKYEKIYANPFTSAFGFYLSTIRQLSILSHGSIDYLRFKNIIYEKVKLLFRTRKWMKKPSQYFGLVDVIDPKEGYVFVSQTKTQWNIEIPNIDVVEEEHSKSVFCAWTEHSSYKEAYSRRMISLNARLVKEFCDFNRTRVVVLFIKFHRRGTSPSKHQREMIRDAFLNYVDNIVFMDELLGPKYANYLPAELLIRALDIKNVISSRSAVSWNCASMKDVNCYSFLSLGAKEIGLLKFVVRYYYRLNRLIRKSPHDFSYTIPT